MRVLIPEITRICEVVMGLGMLRLGTKLGSQLEASEPWVINGYLPEAQKEGSGGQDRNWVVLEIFQLMLDISNEKPSIWRLNT